VQASKPLGKNGCKVPEKRFFLGSHCIVLPPAVTNKNIAGKLKNKDSTAKQQSTYPSTMNRKKKRNNN